MVARLNIKTDVRSTASAWAFARMQARQAVPAIIGGYRALGCNYRQNGTILDLISHGPYGGIEITFSRGTSSTAAEMYSKPPSKRLLRERKSRCTPHSKGAVFAPKARIS